jgi:predicted metallo-beta-lactamase superfamily hydrolase
MDIEIIGAESFGARSLCCFVTTRNRKILIDPGVALGMYRSRLPPHPREVVAVEDTRKRIIERWTEATDIVISHFHGDHSPLVHADVYQLAVSKIRDLNSQATIWIKPPGHFGGVEKKRAPAFKSAFGGQAKSTADQRSEEVSFSRPVPHGDPNDTSVTVIMTCIRDDVVFVHASDIQMLNDEAVETILAWRPDIVLAAGPPIYLAHKLSKEQLDRAERNTITLLRKVNTVILDHHLLRSEEGTRWCQRLSSMTGNTLVSAAEFMAKSPQLLEAHRKQLYQDAPVPRGWHQAYAAGRASTDAYR